MLEQSLASQLGLESIGAPERDTLTVTGRPARRLRFRGASRLEIVLVPRGSIYYVLVGGGALQGASVESCAAGLKLLE